MNGPTTHAKRGPKGFLDDGEHLAEIRAVLESRLFVGEAHRKIWARLRHERGIRTSMRCVLRIMRANRFLARDRPVGVCGPDTHDRTITTETSDRMWAIDAIGYIIAEGNATAFVVVDHCAGECLGARAALRGKRFEDIECRRQAIYDTPSDRGTLQGRRRPWDQPPARPRALVHLLRIPARAQDRRFRLQPIHRPAARRERMPPNILIKRFIRILETQLRLLQTFDTAEELHRVIREFAQRFNNHWIDRLDRLTHARAAPSRTPGRGPVNACFNLSREPDAVVFLQEVEEM